MRFNDLYFPILTFKLAAFLTLLVQFSYKSIHKGVLLKDIYENDKFTNKHLLSKRPLIILVNIFPFIFRN